MSNKLSQGRRFRCLIGIMEAVTSRKPNGRRTEYPFLDWRIPIMADRDVIQDTGGNSCRKLSEFAGEIIKRLEFLPDTSLFP